MAERYMLPRRVLWLVARLAKIPMSWSGIMRQQDTSAKGDEGAVNHVVIKLVLVRTAGPWTVGAGRATALALHKAHGLLRSGSKLKALYQQQVVPGRIDAALAPQLLQQRLALGSGNGLARQQ